MAWILDTTIPDIYTDNTVQGNVHNCLESPYPKIMWYVSENPYDIKTAATKDYHTPCLNYPYPAVMWYVTPDGNDIKTARTKDYHICLEHPFPYILWYVKGPTDPDVTHDYFFEYGKMGAFMGCENLETVKIPKSVKCIGEAGFMDTDITEVKIAVDCLYIPQTTFPEDCDITFYDP